MLTLEPLKSTTNASAEVLAKIAENATAAIKERNLIAFFPYQKNLYKN
jgi:hypothetical protein